MISDADAATLPRVVVAGQKKAGVLLIGWHQWRAVQPFSFVVRKRVWLVRQKTIQKRASIFPTLSLRSHQQFSSEKNRNKSEPIVTVLSPPSTRPLEACRILSRLGVACLSPDTCAVLSSVHYDNPALCPSPPEPLHSDSLTFPQSVVTTQNALSYLSGVINVYVSRLAPKPF